MTLASQITANANVVDRFSNIAVPTVDTDLQQSFQHHLFLLYKQRFLGVNISMQESEDDLENLFDDPSKEIAMKSETLETNHHHIYIRITKLNTFVTISNEYQEPCLSFSLGQLQLKSALQRKTNFAFKKIIHTILQFLFEHKVTQYTVYLRGPLMTMRKYYSKLMTLADLEQSFTEKDNKLKFNAVAIILNTNTAHGGCRLRHTPRK